MIRVDADSRSERLVLVRLSALGDIVHTWPLAEAIRDCHPDLRLTWVVEEHFRILVEGHPAVSDVVTVASRAWRSRPFDPSVWRRIAGVKSMISEPPVRWCLDAQGLLKSGLVAKWSRAEKRIGLARPWRREWVSGIFYTDTVAGTAGHVAATNLELMRGIGCCPPQGPPRPNGRWLADRLREQGVGVEVEQPCAIILPGAGWESKIVPVATLGEVAIQIAGHGFQPVVAWGPGEESRAAAVVDHSRGRARLAPPTSIGELVVLLDEAGLVIGGDTGPTHLAASLGVPTVAVFLSTDWRRNGPLGERVAVVSAIREEALRPSGSAGAEQVREIDAQEIVDAALALVESAR